MKIRYAVYRIQEEGLDYNDFHKLILFDSFESEKEALGFINEKGHPSEIEWWTIIKVYVRFPV